MQSRRGIYENALKEAKTCCNGMLGQVTRQDVGLSGDNLPLARDTNLNKQPHLPSLCDTGISHGRLRDRPQSQLPAMAVTATTEPARHAASTICLGGVLRGG